MLNRYSGKLLGETMGCAVLDSGCSKSVCSKQWLEAYKDTLSEEERKQIEYADSDSKFRFGDDKVYQSSGLVIIPAEIGGTNINIATDVIETEIPLLLSKKAMKKSNTVIDFQKDNVSMFGKEIPLRFISSGHYCIPLNRCVKFAYNEYVVANTYITDTHTTWSDKKRIVNKIHKQFSHASGERLKKLLLDGGIQDKELIEMTGSIDKSCTICQKYKRLPPQPIVCMPLAKNVKKLLLTVYSKYGLQHLVPQNKYSLIMVESLTMKISVRWEKNSTLQSELLQQSHLGRTVLMNVIMGYWVK